MDKNTDSRHESSALLEQVKQKKSSAEEQSVSREDRDNSPSNFPEEKQEFAVPITPSSHRRKNRKPNKVDVKTQDKNETVNIEKKESYVLAEDNESQQGRKRNVSDGETDAQQVQDMEAQENVS